MKIHKTVAIAPFIAMTLPSATFAAVEINEIAWMGTTESYADEWIELRNTGASAVDVTGWVLSWSDVTIRIGDDTSNAKETRNTRIPVNGYMLFERTDDDTVSAKSADVIYTGSLANSGATLTLTDASGSSIDSVSGGSDWGSVGGDNESKHTAQRTSSGWITAAPTPGASNAKSSRSNDSDTDDSSTGSQDDEGGGGSRPSGNTYDRKVTTYNESTTVTREERERRAQEREETEETTQESELNISVPEAGIVNVPIEFYAEVIGIDGDVEDAVQFRWSFGDGAGSSESEAEHIFSYSGTYAITVRARFDDTTLTREVALEIREPAIEIVDADAEKVVIKNDGTAPVTLADWKLSAGSESFTIPEGTKVLAGARVALAQEITGLSTRQGVVLLYPTGDMATEYSGEHETNANLPAVRTTSNRTVSTERTAPAEAGSADKNTSADEVGVQQDESTSKQSASIANAQLSSTTLVAEDNEESSLFIWVAALAGLLGIAAISAIVIRQSSQSPEEEAASYTITEDGDL